MKNLVCFSLIGENFKFTKLKNITNRYYLYEKGLFLLWLYDSMSNEFEFDSKFWLSEERRRYIKGCYWVCVDNPFERSSKECLEEENLRKSDSFKYNKEKKRKSKSIELLFKRSLIYSLINIVIISKSEIYFYREFFGLSDIELSIFLKLSIFFKKNFLNLDNWSLYKDLGVKFNFFSFFHYYSAFQTGILYGYQLIPIISIFPFKRFPKDLVNIKVFEGPEGMYNMLFNMLNIRLYGVQYDTALPINLFNSESRNISPNAIHKNRKYRIWKKWDIFLNKLRCNLNDGIIALKRKINRNFLVPWMLVDKKQVVRINIDIVDDKKSFFFNFFEPKFVDYDFIKFSILEIFSKHLKLFIDVGKFKFWNLQIFSGNLDSRFGYYLLNVKIRQRLYKKFKKFRFYEMRFFSKNDYNFFKKNLPKNKIQLNVYAMFEQFFFFFLKDKTYGVFLSDSLTNRRIINSSSHDLFKSLIFIEKVNNFMFKILETEKIGKKSLIDYKYINFKKIALKLVFGNSEQKNDILDRFKRYKSKHDFFLRSNSYKEILYRKFLLFSDISVLKNTIFLDSIFQFRQHSLLTTPKNLIYKGSFFKCWFFVPFNIELFSLVHRRKIDVMLGIFKEDLVDYKYDYLYLRRQLASKTLRYNIRFWKEICSNTKDMISFSTNKTYFNKTLLFFKMLMQVQVMVELIFKLEENNEVIEDDIYEDFYKNNFYDNDDSLW